MSQPNLLFLHVLPPVSNTSRYGSFTDHKQRLLAKFRMFSCIFRAVSNCTTRVFWRGDVFGFEIIKISRHATTFLFRVT